MFAMNRLDRMICREGGLLIGLDLNVRIEQDPTR